MKSCQGKLEQQSKHHSNSRPAKLSSATVTTTMSGHSSPFFDLQPSRKHCLKCQGWVVVQAIDLSEKVETRCLNCGWQPRYGTRIIKETEEAKAIRRFTGRFLSGSSEKTSLSSVEQSFMMLGQPLLKRRA